ncbi:phage head-tail connector protein [Streptococcus uberis]|uniref:phage head-tail connector protein n=1 Tax=Streptococcus uberis TaxID=1349 RepID=UPI0020BF1B79|nr:phage head-tail connector protein [Streptococcus uberis]
MDKELLLTEVKIFKGISANDTTQDELINLAIDESIQRILAKLNDYSETEITEVPTRLTFIVRDVAIKRYNRLNSEGTKADSEEGRSFSWDDYLAEYDSTLRNTAYGKRYHGKGVARFI